MKKIRTFDEMSINLDSGKIVLHIRECSDGIWNLEIEDFGNDFRIGIPSKYGISFEFWKDIKKELQKE